MNHNSLSFFLLNKKIKNRYLIYFILCGIILGMFVGNVSHNVNATASSITYSVNFDTTGYSIPYPGGVAINEPWLTSSLPKDKGNWEVNGSTVTSEGSRGFIVNYLSNHRHYLNFTTVNNNFISFSTYVRSMAGISYGYYRWMIKDINNVTMFSFYSTTDTNKLGFSDDGSHHLFAPHSQGVSEYKHGAFLLTISIVDIYTANITIKNCTGVYLGGHDYVLSIPIYNISQIVFDMYPAYYCVVLDEISLTLGTTIVMPTTFQPSDYYTLGLSPCENENIHYGTGVRGIYKKIAMLYNSYFTGSVYAVDLYITQSQYSQDINLSNYHLYINNFLFQPTSIESYGCTSYFGDAIYVLRCVLTSPVIIRNDVLCLAWFHTWKMLPSNQYWRVFESSTDLNYDGLIEHRESNNDNGNYEGGNPLVDISYKVYYKDAESTPLNPGYADNINLFNYRYASTYYRNDTLMIQYTISEFSTQNTYINIYNKTSKTQVYSNQGYPKLISSFEGLLSCFLNASIGSYNVTITRGIIVKSVNFTVIDNPDPSCNGYLITTIPGYTVGQTSFTVLYRYYNAYGYNGALAMYYDINDVGDYLKGIFKKTIDVNTSLTPFTYYPTKNGNSYWQLFINRSGIMYPVCEFHTHLNNELVYTNYIDATSSYDFLVDTPILIFGTTSLSSANLYILLDGVEVKPVTTSSFTTSTILHVAKSYQVSLAIKNSDSSYTKIANDSFIVRKTGAGAELGEQYGISGIYLVIIGMSIPFGFLLIPIFLQSMLHINLGGAGIFIYLFFGLMGLVISVVLNLLAPVVLGIIFLILVLVLVIIWIRRE